MAVPISEGGKGDISVTALYTAGTWTWGRVSNAHLFDTPESRGVFRATNAVLSIARLFRWSARSLRHGLLHRHAMIDHLLRESRAPQVVELAAGLAPRGVTFSACEDVEYLEVDLPHVVRYKRGLLERTEEGRAVAARRNLRLIEADVAELDLASLVTPGRRASFVAEGLCMYLGAPEQRALWRRVAAALGGTGGTFVFDLVPSCEEPRPGLTGRALGWLMRRFTKGRTFERDERTRADIIADLLGAGFDEVSAVEPGQVARAWSLPSPEKRTQQLLFVCRKDRRSPLASGEGLC